MKKVVFFLIFLAALKSLQCAEIKPQAAAAITYTAFKQTSPGVIFIPGIGPIDIVKGPINLGSQNEENKKK